MEPGVLRGHFDGACEPLGEPPASDALPFTVFKQPPGCRCQPQFITVTVDPDQSIGIAKFLGNDLRDDTPAIVRECQELAGGTRPPEASFVPPKVMNDLS